MNFDNLFRLFLGPSFSNRKQYEDDGEVPNEDHPNFFSYSSTQWGNEFEQLDEMMMKFLQESFIIFSEPPVYQEPVMMPADSGSLRDQMLKPGFIDKLQKEENMESEKNTKLNDDLDKSLKNDVSLITLLPVTKDDGMHYSTRSSIKYFHNSNGAVESRSTANDRDGCLRELITRELNGKKYVMEKKQCFGAPPQITETLVNLTRDELPEFFQNWKIDNSTGNEDMFKPFKPFR